MSQALVEATVGQLVVERPSRARVFEKFGIDYCCGGKKPLRQAIAEKGLQTDQVVAALDSETADGAHLLSKERDWSTASLTDLCDHIERVHHGYLKDELPRLAFLTNKVANRHGENHPELVEIHRIFLGFETELVTHMAKEERVLFPILRQLDTADLLPPAHCGSVNNPIAVMLQEHDDAGADLARFRELTNDYTPPLDACTTYRAMLDALRQLEQDMHQHVHKENNILFPKAQRMEKLLSRG
ncbi:MAG TPA: iron-sulfur cluster repair di-iron protein [Tepidisphaeraceae bacterium]|nr:iron-sulfur cluster repair di-iron protein [Tepidisphaeraceae bacterium]